MGKTTLKCSLGNGICQQLAQDCALRRVLFQLFQRSGNGTTWSSNLALRRVMTQTSITFILKLKSIIIIIIIT
jgi:hypothetical protein